MSNIEEDIKRCQKLTEPQNADWLGLTNQQAIAHLIVRVEELEDENRVQRHLIMNVYDNGYIPKQKVKDKIEELKKHYNTDNNIRIYTLKDSYELQATVLEELLEESK